NFALLNDPVYKELDFFCTVLYWCHLVQNTKQKPNIGINSIKKTVSCSNEMDHQNQTGKRH
ncbi:MAG: hypothetical protein VYE00_03425, partial [Candidatus Poribacteria bacterium]|nr:hypothetical protein [Candidatus Poribacteria bacterium]